MQITPETLKQSADTTVEKYTRSNYDIMAAYLHGSLVMGSNPLLGGTTDIDLVFIHADTPDVSREILHLTDEVHLDIEHHSQTQYLKGRDLRVDPWIGPSLFNAQVIFDPQHFLDFTIATVRGMFHRPDHIMMRVGSLVEAARHNWKKMQEISTTENNQSIVDFLNCINNIANALALLVGEPLTERRFLSSFARRLERLERTGMYAGILGLLGAPKAEVRELYDWISFWDKAFDSLPTNARPSQIHPHRKNYYLRAFEAILSSKQPKNVLWPLLNTWVSIAQLINEEDPASLNWQEAIKQLGLYGEDIQDKIIGLDKYLEQAEEVIEIWAMDNGV